MRRQRAASESPSDGSQGVDYEADFTRNSSSSAGPGDQRRAWQQRADYSTGDGLHQLGKSAGSLPLWGSPLVVRVKACNHCH